MKAKWKASLPWFGVIVGSIVFSLGFQLFLVPNEIVPGGVSGIAMVINYLTGLPVGVLIIIINVPVFWVAWRALGRNFFLKSLVGTAVSSIVVDLIALANITATYDHLLAAVYGGVIMGIGLGVIFVCGASTGGSDIIAKLLEKKYAHVNLGQLMLVVDFFVVLLGIFVFRSYDVAMYALITIFISSKVIDLILYGFDYSKVVYIVSDIPQSLGAVLMQQVDTGLTILYGRGGYSGQEREILMCAIHRQQFVALKQTVRETDPEAFVIISEAREVFGFGFKPNE